MEETNNLRKWKTQADNCLKIVQETYDALTQANQPADRTLMKICRRDHRFGSRDRRFFYRTVFAYYRWLGWIRHSSLANAELKKQLFAALVTEHDAQPLPPGAQIWADELGFTAEDVEKILALTGPLERFLAASGVRDELTLAMLAPDWVPPELAPGAKRHFIPHRSPVWVRVVPGAEEAALAAWKKAALEPMRHPRIESAWRFDPESHARFEDMVPWREGKFEVQDFSSQCIGLAADAHEGEHWFDACAGGGGKTLQLCAMMHGRGTVSVYDIRARKLEELHERAKRTPFRHMIRISETDLPEKQFDGVLIDAPCSSSGRWRRNPDMRWVLTPEALENIIDVQHELLNKYAPCVRPGGKLVFGTCSVFTRENAGNAGRFLAEHPEFEPVPFTSPHNGELRTDGMLQTFPADSDCDGSFVAVFRRKNI